MGVFRKLGQYLKIVDKPVDSRAGIFCTPEDAEKLAFYNRVKNENPNLRGNAYWREVANQYDKRDRSVCV
jgi:hypothetical protein